MNVMITCAGRRNLLVRYFRAALQGKGTVYGADASPNAPALQEADESFVVPSIDDPGYFDTLLELCQRHRIGLLLSVSDLELPLLARQCDRFRDVGTIPVVSSPEVVDTCFDKARTATFLEGIGLPGPKTFLSLSSARQAVSDGDLSFPLVVKPRWGTASIGVEFPKDDEELELAHRLVTLRIRRSSLAAVSASDAEHAVMIQEQVAGQEYGLDVVNDLKGRYTTTFVKLKLSHSMLSDGVGQATTVENPQLEALGRSIGQRLGHVGNLDVDVFVSDGKCHVLDLNPRFGGGYPFSHSAGADVPAALIAWASGDEPAASWLRVRPDVKAARFDEVVLIR